MIDGIGIDVVDIDRFKASLERTPGLLEKLFTEAERSKAIASLAARFAAKEALAKALNAGKGLSWHEAEIVNLESGKPAFCSEVKSQILLMGQKYTFLFLMMQASHLPW